MKHASHDIDRGDRVIFFEQHTLQSGWWLRTGVGTITEWGMPWATVRLELPVLDCHRSHLHRSWAFEEGRLYHVSIGSDNKYMQCIPHTRDITRLDLIERAKRQFYDHVRS